MNIKIIDFAAKVIKFKFLIIIRIAQYPTKTVGDAKAIPNK